MNPDEQPGDEYFAEFYPDGRVSALYRRRQGKTTRWDGEGWKGTQRKTTDMPRLDLREARRASRGTTRRPPL